MRVPPDAARCQSPRPGSVGNDNLPHEFWGEGGE
jgi:hypothetical protein